MQVEIKLDNLEMKRVIKDGTLLSLIESVEDENKFDTPKSAKAVPVPMPTVEVNKAKVEVTEPEVKEDKQVEEKEYTLEEVRAMFAAKNKPAQRSKLKALLKKYNATNISGLDPKDYASVVADLGEI